MFDKHVAQLIGSDSTIDKSAFVRLIIAVVRDYVFHVGNIKFDIEIDAILFLMISLFTSGNCFLTSYKSTSRHVSPPNVTSWTPSSTSISTIALFFGYERFSTLNLHFYSFYSSFLVLFSDIV